MFTASCKLVGDRGAQGANRFRRRRDDGDDHAAQCIWHMQGLDQIVDRAGHCLGQHDDRQHIGQQQHRVPPQRMAPMRRLGLVLVVIEGGEITAMPPGLDRQESAVKSRAHQGDKDLLRLGKRGSRNGHGENSASTRLSTTSGMITPR